MQRREVVVRACGRELRIALEQLAQAVAPPQRGCFEDVELTLLGEPACPVFVAAVEGLHDLAHLSSLESLRSLRTRPPVWQVGQ